MLLISTALVHVDRTRTHVVKSCNGSARFPDRWTRRAYGMRWRRCSLTRCVCLVLWWCSPMCWWRGEEIRAARSCPPSTGCFWSWPSAGWWRRSSSTTHTGHHHQCCSLSFLLFLRTTLLYRPDTWAKTCFIPDLCCVHYGLSPVKSMFKQGKKDWNVFNISKCAKG